MLVARAQSRLIEGPILFMWHVPKVDRCTWWELYSGQLIESMFQNSVWIGGWVRPKLSLFMMQLLLLIHLIPSFMWGSICNVPRSYNSSSLLFDSIPHYVQPSCLRSSSPPSPLHFHFHRPPSYVACSSLLITCQYHFNFLSCTFTHRALHIFVVFLVYINIQTAHLWANTWDV